MPRLIRPYSMAPAGQPQIQAMQWVQRSPQTGRPSWMRMFPSGQSRWHFPQDTQASETVKGPVRT